MKTKKNAIVLLAVILSVITMFYGCSNTSREQTSKTETKDGISASNKGKKLNIVSSESKLEWTGKKVTGQHNGTVDITKGDLFIDNNTLTGGNFDIDFTSIKVVDITDPETNSKLTGHLKSDDFFSAGSFPIGKFEIKSLAPLSDGTGNNYSVTGNLTIKGITKEITFPAKVNINSGSVTATADFNIDRTFWDIKFRSGKFYENLGDKLISDDFNIKFNVTAKQN